MPNLWISKKSKKEMRVRRKKKEHQSKNGGDDKNQVGRSSTKRKEGDGKSSSNEHELELEQSTTHNWESVQNETVCTVTIPSTCTTKDGRKLRKEARRKARREGRDDSLIKFVDEHGVELISNNDDKSDPSNDQEDNDDTNVGQPARKKRKKAKSFININQALADAEEAKRIQKEKEKKEAYEKSIPVEVKAKYIALDCEMVGIGTDGKQSALARVSITGWDDEIILDTFVQVPDRVTDFRTYVSGVRAKDIRSTNVNAMELHACRRQVGEILKNKILVGHSLKNDFSALMLDHPRHMIRDTARYKPFMRASGRNGGKLRPRKLRDLVKEHVGLEIQKEGEEHTSVEDAQATLKLFKAFREKWEKEIEMAASGKLGRGGKKG